MFTEDELKLIQGALVHLVCDVNHDHQSEMAINRLIEKVKSSSGMVYVVSGGIAYEGSHIQGIFTDKSEADKLAAVIENGVYNNHNFDYAEVETHKVDSVVVETPVEKPVVDRTAPLTYNPFAKLKEGK